MKKLWREEMKKKFGRVSKRPGHSLKIPGKISKGKIFDVPDDLNGGDSTSPSGKSTIHFSIYVSIQ